MAVNSHAEEKLSNQIEDKANGEQPEYPSSTEKNGIRRFEDGVAGDVVLPEAEYIPVEMDEIYAEG